MMYNELVQGDETLGYNDGLLEWTPILSVQEPEVQPLWTVDTKKTHLVCTRDHLWLTARPKWKREDIQLRTLEDQMSQDQIVTTGLWHCEDLEIRVTTARLYGLLVAGRAKLVNGTAIHMESTDVKRRAHLRRVLFDIPHRRYSKGNNHRYIYAVSGLEARRIYWVNNYTLLENVWRMNDYARSEFLDCLLGDAYDGPIVDEVALAAFLGDGMIRMKPFFRVVKGRMLLKGTTFQPLNQEVPVWCVTTRLGTWTTKYNGHVMLTGG